MRGEVVAPRAAKVTRSVLIALLGCYLALCGVARVGYPHVLFPAPRLDLAPDVGTNVGLLDLPQHNGSHTAALYYPPPEGARTVVVFHGNGETIFDNTGLATELSRRGLGVLLVEYRGYGTTYGPPPSEAMLYEDGEAALAWLAREHVAADRIALWGWSLGTGVAAEMARRGHGARLVLLAPFTSMIDMGQRFAPILPVSLLMSHRFDTLSKASAITQNTLVVHGDEDSLIPFSMGVAVARAMPNARLLRVEGGHHADLLYSPGPGQGPDSTARPAPQELFDILTVHLSAD